MSELFSIFFTIFINILEVLLVFRILHSKLKLKKKPNLILSCFIIDVFAITATNFLSGYISDNVRMLITLFINISIAFVISTSNLSQKIFWGSIYWIICILSDTLTFQVGLLFTQNSPQELLFEEPICYIMTLIYILFSFIAVQIITFKKSSSFAFPWYIYLMFIFLIIIDIVAVESLLDLLVAYPTSLELAQIILFFSILVLIISSFFLLVLIEKIGNLYKNNLLLLEEKRQKQAESMQYELLTSTNKFLREWKHDIHNYLMVMQVMLEKKNYSELQDYLTSMTKQINQSSWSIKTGNNIIDAIISSKYMLIKSNNIKFSHIIFLPENLPINDMDLTALLGNLLDNALESCKAIPEDTRYINLEIKPYNQFLSISVTNSCSGKYLFDANKRLLTTKSSTGHGVGLRRIEAITNKVDGILKVIPGKDAFKVDIIIPLN